MYAYTYTVEFNESPKVLKYICRDNVKYVFNIYLCHLSNLHLMHRLDQNL